MSKTTPSKAAAKPNADAAAKAAAAEKAKADAAAAQAAADTKAKADAEAKALADATNPANTDKVPALRVTAKRDGFRRGGRAWKKEATVVKLSDLNEEQISQIKGETAMLTVEEIEVGAE